MAGSQPQDSNAIEGHEIDSEHRLQVSLLQALRDAMEGRSADVDIETIVDQLADFSRVHFTSEQLLMRLYGYENFAPHLEEHERAMDKLEELRNRLKTDDTAGARACLETFSTWLTDHLHHTDRELSKHLQNVGG
jgi:hemerythrin